MVRAFLLLLLLEQVSSLRHPLRSYHYVDIYKSWDGAREYCKANYEDIAMFKNTDDLQLLSKPDTFGSIYSWIGLWDDPAHWRPHMGNSTNSWVWSATGKHSRTRYQNFSRPSEPDNYAAGEECVLVDFQGAWLDIDCSFPHPFACFTDNGGEISLNHPPLADLSWTGALQYCRNHHTDMFMVEDAAANKKIVDLRASNAVWIGLSRQPWNWADGSPLAFNNWQGGAPDNRGKQFCVAENDMHKWEADTCATSHPFICQKVNILLNKVKVGFQSTANMADPNVQAQVLKQLEERLRARGYNVSDLKFSIKPQALK